MARGIPPSKCYLMWLSGVILCNTSMHKTLANHSSSFSIAVGFTSPAFLSHTRALPLNASPSTNILDLLHRVRPPLFVPAPRVIFSIYKTGLRLRTRPSRLVPLPCACPPVAAYEARAGVSCCIPIPSDRNPTRSDSTIFRHKHIHNGCLRARRHEHEAP